MTARTRRPCASVPTTMRGRVPLYGVLDLRVLLAPGTGRRGMTAGSAAVPKTMCGHVCRYGALGLGVAPAAVDGGGA